MGLTLAAAQFARDLPGLLDAGARRSGSRCWGCPRRWAVRGHLLPRVRPRTPGGQLRSCPGRGRGALLYGAYHVGYGMGVSELWFLLALGVVYAVAYRLTTNVLILWPLLTPIGAFFNNLRSRGHRPPLGVAARLRRRRHRHGSGDLARPPSGAQAAIQRLVAAASAPDGGPARAPLPSGQPRQRSRAATPKAGRSRRLRRLLKNAPIGVSIGQRIRTLVVSWYATA